MIVDSSALIAIVEAEQDHLALRKALRDATETVRIAAPTLLEASIVADARGRSRVFDAVVRGANIEVVPFDAEMAALARAAYRDFGRGSGHPADLNFGDCFSYALARATGDPLLQGRRLRPHRRALGARLRTDS